MDNRRRAVMGITKGGRLPSEYQEVAYLQSTGEQYIDTGAYLSNTDSINCSFEITEEPIAGQNEAVFGVTNVTLWMFFIILMRNPIIARVGQSSQQAASSNYKLNFIYNVTLKSGLYVENNIQYSFQNTSLFEMTRSCYIFARNQQDYESYFIKAKIYNFEIENKFFGVPCYRKADNKPGLYDLVNDAFYTNANTSASTDFIVGPDVN